MIRVLFVCLGNICRSPMAEAVFRDKVEKAGLADHFEIDSAGTGGWHVGETAHQGTLDILAQHGISHDGRSRQFTVDDLEKFDYVLVMDEQNLRDVQALARFRQTGAVIKKFLAFAPGIPEEDVPDPYYEGGFDRVYEMVDAAAGGLLDHIRETRDL